MRAKRIFSKLIEAYTMLKINGRPLVMLCIGSEVLKVTYILDFFVPT